uniref:Uncharacterized protein n=1 Tax=Arundo donax TaxID=35708 RepID=A0A0A9G1E5_ARUDO
MQAVNFVTGPCYVSNKQRLLSEKQDFHLCRMHHLPRPRVLCL